MPLKKWRWMMFGFLVAIAFFAFLQMQQPVEKTLSESPRKPSVASQFKLYSRGELFFEDAKLSFQTIEISGERVERIVMQNPSDKTIKGQLLVLIPKEVASDVMDVRIEGASAIILEDDPVLLIPFQLKPKETKSVGLRVKQSQAGILAVPIPEGFSRDEARQILELIRPKNKVLYATQDDAVKYAKSVYDVLLKEGKLTEKAKEALAKLAEGLFVEPEVVQQPVKATAKKKGIDLDLESGPVVVETVSTLLPEAVIYVQFFSPLPVPDLEKSLFGNVKGELRKYVKESGFVAEAGQVYYRIKLSLRDVAVVDDKLDLPGVLTGQIEMASAILPEDRAIINVVVFIKNLRLQPESAPKDTSSFVDFTLEAAQDASGDWVIANNLAVPYRITCGGTQIQIPPLAVKLIPASLRINECLRETANVAYSCSELRELLNTFRAELIQAYTANLLEDLYVDEILGKTNYELMTGDDIIRATRMVRLETYEDDRFSSDWDSCVVNGQTINAKAGYVAAAIQGKFFGEGEFQAQTSG